MKRGEVTSLLGHNGAGKSSIINILTGLHNPTHGEAFVFGLSVREEMAHIQSIMGIVPQENVLWDHLTAREHLELYACFKGMTDRAAIDADVDSCLRSVKLYGVPGVASTFSGGMKRRLHCAMAFVGNPSLIFADEPSTGMDTYARRVVWQALESRKKNAVVLLTTHSMEEADFLGDQIAIMSNGRLRAKGTSLFLKHHFGAGYQINLMSSSTSQQHIDELTRSVNVQLPGAEVLNVSAGAMTIALPRKAVVNVPRFFRWLDSHPQVVKEWGISDSTLEEACWPHAALRSALTSPAQCDVLP
jgi:ABC-type multidrug transport system ATPase subunit